MSEAARAILLTFTALIVALVALGLVTNTHAATLRVTADQTSPWRLDVTATIRAERPGWARVGVDGLLVERAGFGMFSMKTSRGRHLTRRVRLHKGLNRVRLPARRFDDMGVAEQLARWPLGSPDAPAAIPLVRVPLNAAYVYGRALGERLEPVEARVGGSR